MLSLSVSVTVFVLLLKAVYAEARGAGKEFGFPKVRRLFPVPGCNGHPLSSSSPSAPGFLLLTAKLSFSKRKEAGT